jgi:hypothetical protein
MTIFFTTASEATVCNWHGHLYNNGVLGSDLLHRAEPAWRAAQAQASDLLGKNGSTAIMEIASRIMDA